jgi:hypothetical protein
LVGKLSGTRQGHRKNAVQPPKRQIRPASYRHGDEHRVESKAAALQEHLAPEGAGNRWKGCYPLKKERAANGNRAEMTALLL